MTQFSHPNIFVLRTSEKHLGRLAHPQQRFPQHQYSKLEYPVQAPQTS